MKTKFKLSNRILSLVLAFVMVLGMMPMSSFTAFAADATGTACADSACSGHYVNGFCSVCDGYEKPSQNGVAYIIVNAGNLYWFANYVNTTDGARSSIAYLEADIVVNEKVLDADGNLISDPSSLRAWTPITYGDIQYYMGSFDGNGHSISGLYSRVSGEQTCTGLFEAIGDDASITNLAILDSYFEADGLRSYAGAFAAASLGGEISNCYNGATVRASYAGGFFGFSGGLYAVGCINAGKVISSSLAGVYLGAAGGIVGAPQGVVQGNVIELYLCANIGSVVSESSKVLYVGALVGEAEHSDITYSYFDASKCADSTGPLYSNTTGDFKDVYISDVEAKTSAEFENGTVCQLLGAHSSKYVYTASKHSKVCRICDKVSQTEEYHNTNNICDGNNACTVCGYLVEGHVYVQDTCAICSDVCYSHTFGQDNKCTTCNFYLVAVQSIEPNFSSSAIQGEKIELSAAVLPSNASFYGIDWYVVRNGSEEAVENVATALEAGTLTIRAKVENGKGMGVPYVQDFTVSVEAVETEYDLADGYIIITQYESGKVQIEQRQFNGEDSDYMYDSILVSQKVISENDPVRIKGSSVKSFIEVQSGSPKLVFDSVSLQSTNRYRSPVGVLSGASADITLVGDNVLTAYAYFAGIYVPSGASVVIGGNGSLDVTGGSRGRGAGIGGDYDDPERCSSGNITINGGNITAISYGDAAAIGSSMRGDSEKIVINGGKVTATNYTYDAGTAAGIGSCIGNAGKVEINGGFVVATGGERSPGIGCGYGTSSAYGTAAKLTVTGGTVIALASGYAYGIGSSYYGNAGTTTITGGNVYALGHEEYGNIRGSVTDGKGNTLYLNTITLKGLEEDSTNYNVTGISSNVSYGLKDTVTYGGELYFYFPSGKSATSITAGGVEYICNRNLTYYTEHEYKDATCLAPQTCYCGLTVGEALGHNYVNGICTICGVGEEDGIFYIRTAEQLMKFADHVNAGNQSADAVLMADIDMTAHGNVMIGTSAIKYSGTFDGNGKTLTVNLNSTEEYAAPFRYINGATIQNLTVDGTISTGKKFAAGLVGYSEGAGRIEKCMVAVTINSSVSGDGTHGGLVANVNSGSMTIENCGFIGSITGSSTHSCGGFVGWANGTTTISNSYVAGTFTTERSNCETFGRNPVNITVSNCYYKPVAGGYFNSSGATGKSPDRFESGEVTYLLNGEKSDDSVVWKQTLGTDIYPKLSGGTVYKVGVAAYSNTPHIHDWQYSANGATMTADCVADGCSNTNGGSVTLKVADAYYTGNAAQATASGSFTNGATYVITYNDGTETAPNGVGTHTAILTVFENGTEKASVSAEYKISYLTAPENAYSISGGYEDGDTYWFKDGAAITVKAPEGYTISATLDGTYGESVSFSENDSKVVYLKKTSDGAMTNAITISETISFDADSPTGKITIESRGFWEKLINKITFGLFFKGDKVATVTTADADGSGVKSIQYYLADEDLVGDDKLADANAITTLETAVDGNWSDYKDEIALTKNAKNVIYVKITDNVGNVTYINSEGIVLYTDAEADTESVSTIYKAGKDKDATVKLNGNTVKSIANGTITLTAGTDYSVSTDGVITLKATYLDTLKAGEYTFTVSYNPLGMGYVDGEEPATTTFKVTVERADGAVTNISAQGKTYDGEAVAEPTYTSLSTGKATFEYKLKGADDSTYTQTAPNDAGTYIVRVTVAADTNYKEASDTAEFTIDRAKITNVSVKQNGTLTYNGKALTPIVSTNAVAVNNQPVTFTYSTLQDGTYGTLPSFDKAGSYTVYYKATAPNHNEVTDYFTVTVAKAIVTEPTIASKEYNGEAQTADIPASDLYTVEKNNGGTAKSSYDVVLKLKDADNYIWATDTTGESATVTLQFVISAAQNSWNNKPAIDGWTYGHSANAPTYEAKFGNDTVKVTYEGTANDGTTWNSEDAPAKAGTYKAIFTVDATGDYGSLSEEVRFTIAKADLAELNKPADTTSPNTGDNSNLWLWVALLFISGGATITLTVYDRKKRAAQK